MNTGIEVNLRLGINLELTFLVLLGIELYHFSRLLLLQFRERPGDVSFLLISKFLIIINFYNYRSVYGGIFLKLFNLVMGNVVLG